MSILTCSHARCRQLTRHSSGVCAAHRPRVPRLRLEAVRLLPSEWDRMWMALERQGYHRLAHLLLDKRMERL